MTPELRADLADALEEHEQRLADWVEEARLTALNRDYWRDRCARAEGNPA